VFLGKLTASGERSEVDGLEDLCVELARLFAFKRQSELHEDVCKPLHPYTYRPVPQVGVLGLVHGVPVDVP
jgi:hypothetical protein